MALTSNSQHEPLLDVITVLSDEMIQASLRELRERDRLKVALRSALRAGVPIEDLSAASGLTCGAIRSLVEQRHTMDEDLAVLAGTA